MPLYSKISIFSRCLAFTPRLHKLFVSRDKDIVGRKIMAKPNRSFDLSVQDLDVIETALRARKTSLSARLSEVETGQQNLVEDVHQIHDLLGRLHNQKTFYRPKSGTYVSG